DAPYHVQDSRTGVKNTWVFNTEAHPLRQQDFNGRETRNMAQTISYCIMRVELATPSRRNSTSTNPHYTHPKTKSTKRTAAGIPTWSPTVVLICRSTAYVWQSGRDAQFSADCGQRLRSFRLFGHP
ncbi:hypothetical protein KCU67_g16873, partial [Aureobasidium melanogenum]